MMLANAGYNDAGRISLSYYFTDPDHALITLMVVIAIVLLGARYKRPHRHR